MSGDSIERAVAELRGGRVVIVPTDTVYGLAASADDVGAVRHMFELKGRPADVRVAVLVADVAQAATLVELGPVGETLADAFWPGPLTIVAARHDQPRLAAGDDATLGVRCPDDATVRALAAAVGPIAATSANPHGRDPAATAAEVARAFPEIGTVLDDGPRPGAASTVVSVVEGHLEVIREGPITRAEMDARIGGDA